MRNVCKQKLNFFSVFWNIFVQFLSVDHYVISILAFFIQISAVESIVFQAKNFPLTWPYWLLEFKFKFEKDILISAKNLRIWKLPVWPWSGLIYACCDTFVNDAESLLRRGEFFFHYRTAPNWIEASQLCFYSSFSTCMILLSFLILQCLLYH